jgi:hypothetical protein
MLRFTLAFAEDIEGNCVEPLPKSQCAYSGYRIALQCMIGTEKSLLTDVLCILWTAYQAYGKTIQSLLIVYNEMPEMAIQISSQQ